jgi:immune inhibitor A
MIERRRIQVPVHHTDDFCAVAPSPALQDRWRDEISRLRSARSPMDGHIAVARKPRAIGLDDGVIIPPEEFSPETSLRAIRSAAADRAPLRGVVRVAVVMVDFTDRKMTATKAHLEDLFFSQGTYPNGSVRDYYKEVTGGLIDIQGAVVGPLRMPRTLSWYANDSNGLGDSQRNLDARANIMAADALAKADPLIDFKPYDNDGNGYVDAFVVVHAGRGGEETGSNGDIWSHKWVLPQKRSVDGTNVFAYLTVPEDCRLGVCAHELGHLLFGLPDLYDTDYTSEGVGNWCLMGGGSWNGNGDRPAHMSAWCKVQQGWIKVDNVKTKRNKFSIQDVKSSKSVLRMSHSGNPGSEYFLVENRQRTGFDDHLPAGGLLIWHIDDAQQGNTDETHYQVGLVQADGLKQLEKNVNRGDGGDVYPGTSGNRTFNATSNPSSKNYAGANTWVSLINISPASETMTATMAVTKQPKKKATTKKVAATRARSDGGGATVGRVAAKRAPKPAAKKASKPAAKKGTTTRATAKKSAKKATATSKRPSTRAR